MGQGVGGFVYLSDEDENVSRVSTAGRAYFSDSYTRIKNHSPINVTAASGGSQLESVAVGRAYLRSESGNSPMWWGGTGDDAPYSGHGFPLWGGETSIPIHVTNFNTIQVVASTSGQIVYPIGFLNGPDTTLSNTVPTHPDNIAPFVLSHSPVSGFSGVALNADISVIFSEPVSELSLTSGVFSLSPSHNVTFFRDATDPAKIVLSPNQNMSGSTVYMSKVTTNITDLNGNRLSGQLTWPFTTTAAPPPPDTTPPTISGITPVSGAQSISIDVSPLVVFDEKMLSGTINSTNIYLATTSGTAAGDIPLSISLNAADQKTVTIDPTNDLVQGAITYLNVKTGVQDLAGNALATAVTNHPFTTNYNFVEVYNVTGSSTGDIGASDDTMSGVLIESSSSDLKGSIVKRVTMKLKDDSSSPPSGTATLTIRHYDGGSNSTLIATMGTFDTSILTSSFQDITITNLSNTRVMIEDDMVMLEFAGPGKVDVARVESNSYNGAHYIKKQSSGSFDEGTTYDNAWKIYS